MEAYSVLEPPSVFEMKQILFRKFRERYAELDDDFLSRCIDVVFMTHTTTPFSMSGWLMFECPELEHKLVRYLSEEHNVCTIKKTKMENEWKRVTLEDIHVKVLEESRNPFK